MNRLLPFALALFAATMFFTACGGDDSSSGYVHKNDTSASCGVDDENCECEDDDCDVSSSSKKTAASSSAKEKNDSSSAKSSSSTGDKNSGGESSPASSSVKSSSSGTSAGSSAGNSSSSKAEDLSCTPEEEGQTFEFTLTGKKYICKNGSLIEIASSSSAVPTSSYFDMTNQFNEKVSYGEFTDPRDGHKYRTVDMYDEVFDITYTIFAENLNYGKKILGGAVQGDSTKYCYDDDLWYCENGWGGLYTWSNAMGFPAVCDSFSVASEKCPNKFDLSNENENFNGDVLFTQHQGICPDGWHVMNEDIWSLLYETSGRDVASQMGSMVAGFGSKNSYGLSILPAGYWLLYPSGTMAYDNITKQTVFWLPEQDRDQSNKAKLVNVLRNDMTRSTSRAKSEYAHSVRCVKNY